LDFSGEAGKDEGGELAPRFQGVALKDLLAFFAEDFCGGFDGGVDGFGDGHLACAEAEEAGEFFKAAVEDEHGLEAHFVEGLAGDFSGDEWVAIAIAADPGAEGESGTFFWVVEEGWVEVGFLPCLFELEF
jgi:hypothetical protein